MQAIVERFTEIYYRLNGQSLGLLTDLYSEDIQFHDPFRRITGLRPLMEYFDELYRNVKSVSFRFEETVVQGDNAMLVWTMSLKHPRLNGGDLVTVPGSSHIKFREKVIYHRDYFDAGAMLYENLPLIGMVIRAIKERV
jgi:hypothetical protein